jgi:hypothetical protein
MKDPREKKPFDYEDPEENTSEFDPTRISMDYSDLPDNLSSHWRYYKWRGDAPHSHWPIALAWTREIEPPWRVGMGLLIRRRRRQDTVRGLFFGTADPFEIAKKHLGWRSWRMRRKLKKMRPEIMTGDVLGRRKPKER